MPRAPFALTVLALSAVALGSVAPVAWAAPARSVVRSAPDSTEPAETSKEDTFRQLTLFSDVLERARADYVDPITDEKLIEYALNGMLGSLDPHSGYMNKKVFEDMKTQTHGEFGGLGIEVTMEKGLVKIVSPIDDTPAARAGLQPGDLVTHLDSKPLADVTLNEAVDRMRGPPGTKITLTVRRGGIEGRPFDVTLKRAIIHIQSVRWEPKQDVAYIRVTTFNEQTQPGLDKALAEIDKQMGAKLVGYVLDLRNNPGGLLDQAVSVAGTFLPAGKEVVSTRGRHKEDDQTYASRGGDRTQGKPLAVLVNGGSASASEIVAGALQDYRRAVLVGLRSFGKGSVQTIIPIAGAGAMRLTTARYYTPSGRSIQKLGIEPDIEVQPAKLEKLAGNPWVREADLRGALTNDTLKPGEEEEARANAKPAANDDEAEASAAGEDSRDGAANDNARDARARDSKAKGGKDGKKETPFDYQLARALDLIRGVHVFNAKASGMEKPLPDSAKDSRK